ncbi:hypothetical protein AVEN_231224-1 [Araneus ventricosus]|uniref:Uncharacterized protein n=1 Tax=Araneus ventricosus TaxID=182803 RepID=A0A4Y2TEX9_ARAVE|nr:hypothetical protein AVEN_231224-1 [Araneus ventricosus]
MDVETLVCAHDLSNPHPYGLGIRMALKTQMCARDLPSTYLSFGLESRGWTLTLWCGCSHSQSTDSYYSLEYTRMDVAKTLVWYPRPPSTSSSMDFWNPTRGWTLKL